MLYKVELVRGIKIVRTTPNGEKKLKRIMSAITVEVEMPEGTSSKKVGQAAQEFLGDTGFIWNRISQEG